MQSINANPISFYVEGGHTGMASAVLVEIYGALSVVVDTNEKAPRDGGA